MCVRISQSFVRVAAVESSVNKVPKTCKTFDALLPPPPAPQPQSPRGNVFPAFKPPPLAPGPAAFGLITTTRTCVGVRGLLERVYSSHSSPRQRTIFGALHTNRTSCDTRSQLNLHKTPFCPAAAFFPAVLAGATKYQHPSTVAPHASPKQPGCRASAATWRGRKKTGARHYTRPFTYLAGNGTRIAAAELHGSLARPSPAHFKCAYICTRTRHRNLPNSRSARGFACGMQASAA